MLRGAPQYGRIFQACVITGWHYGCAVRQPSASLLREEEELMHHTIFPVLRTTKAAYVVCADPRGRCPQRGPEV